MTMANEIRHHAPSLKAELVGELDNDLALFRGIPYATVSKRWSHSFVRDTLPTRFNAKEFGQRCVQREGPVMVTGGHHDATPGDHEFDSLNLNIAVPSHALTGGHREGLPVMVWIHGYVLPTYFK
jgi:carboxylesterase type B